MAMAMGRKRAFMLLVSQRSFSSHSTRAQGPSPSPSLLRGIHLFQCPEKTGILMEIAKCLETRGANILNVDVYVDLYSNQAPLFSSRSEFVFDPLQWSRNNMDEDFRKISSKFTAQKSIIKVPETDPPQKIGLLASWQDHCLLDILHQWQEGKLPFQIASVISNHEREADSDVIRILERHQIPYHYVPANKKDKKEDDILQLVSDTDLLVLARYMQILSPRFLNEYGRDVINIHHSFLPSFKGANPYKQAYDAGVKMIGATSHFVSEELDGGPIIEQMVERVSHRDTLKGFSLKSENLEKQCLTKAIKYYCELRILRDNRNKTIIFD